MTTLQSPSHATLALLQISTARQTCHRSARICDTRSSLEEYPIKTWNNFRYKGETYSLAHLDEFHHEYIQAASDTKTFKTYRFVIEFSLHCFAKGPNTKKGETLADFDSALYYRDSRETRVFCFDRHQLSYRLPDIARQISQRPCYHSGQGNFFVVDLVNYSGVMEEYEVYFKVSRSGKGLLRLFVESAYVRDKEHGTSQPIKKKINFFVIAHNIQVGKKIKAHK